MQIMTDNNIFSKNVNETDQYIALMDKLDKKKKMGAITECPHITYKISLIY